MYIDRNVETRQLITVPNECGRGSKASELGGNVVRKDRETTTMWWRKSGKGGKEGWRWEEGVTKSWPAEIGTGAQALEYFLGRHLVNKGNEKEWKEQQRLRSLQFVNNLSSSKWTLSRPKEDGFLCITKRLLWLFLWPHLEHVQNWISNLFPSALIQPLLQFQRGHRVTRELLS